jgi:hypothetical protein
MSCVDAIVRDEEENRRKHEPANVNDNAATLESLKALRPHLYYERGKGLAKWCNPVRQFIKFA